MRGKIMIVKTKKQVLKKFPKGIEKLEIGSGDNPEAGYVHLDIQKGLPGLDILSDVRKMPLPDNFVSDHIRAVHIMEHFCHPKFAHKSLREKYGTVLEVLDEAYRVLKPGGKFRIVTPDFEKICQSGANKRVDWDWLQRWSVGGYDNEYDIHHWLWTHADAQKWFKKTGFKNLKDWNIIWNPLEIAKYKISPPKENSKDWHRYEWYHWLFFEGTK
jgi:predicted SAM-dependent methyltransferase